MSTGSAASQYDGGSRLVRLASSLGAAGAASLLAVALTRLWTWSNYLWAWDSVNFALALRDIDVGAHQPHPPGYLGFVLVARALNWTDDANVALLSVVLLASAITATLTWSLARDTTGSPIAAWIAWTVVIFSPLHWFYGSVAEVYAAETAVATAVAAASYAVQKGRPGSLALLALALLAASLVKLPVVVLFLPLIAAVILGIETRRRVHVGLIAAGAIVSAVVMLAMVEPLDVMFATSTGQVGEVARTSFLSTWNPRALNRSVRDMLYAGFACAGLATATIACTRGISRLNDSIFVLAWVTPFVLSSALIHFPKPGYLLPLLPAIAVALVAGTSSWSSRKAALVSAFIAVVSTVQFVWLHPFDTAITGGNRRYADKTLPQQMATEVNSILRPSYHSIKRSDERLAQFREAIANHCGPARQSLVVVEDGGDITWRHAMFYVPAAMTVQLSSSRAGLLVAKNRRMLERPQRIRAASDCIVHVAERTSVPLLAGDEPRSATTVWVQSQRLDVYPGEFRLEVDGERAAIRRSGSN